jgi:hypothetical protein
MNRPPIGISVLGLFALMSGVSQAFTGFQLMGIVALGPVPTGNGIFIAGLFSVIVGVIYLAVAFGAWSLKPWTYEFGLIMSVLGIFNGVIMMLLTGSLAYGVAVLIFPTLVYWYLNREDVRGAFVRSGTPPRA